MATAHHLTDHTRHPDPRRIVVEGTRVRDAAGRTAGEVVARGVAADRRGDVQLAVHEVLVNAWEHGHLGDPTLPIDVRIDTEVTAGHARRVTVTVTDLAVGGSWDPDALPRTAVTGERGRGLVLARAVCDALSLRSRDDATTVELAWGPSAPARADERG